MKDEVEMLPETWEHLPKIGGVILAGGKSTRMGTEKGLVDFAGRPLISWAIECLKPLTGGILIVANDAAYQQFGYPVQEDEARGDGPLSGMVSGLRHSKYDLNFVIACDMPLVNCRLLLWILAMYDGEAAAVCKLDGHLQPLVGLYHRRAIAKWERLLTTGQLKMRIALEEIQAAILDPERSMPDFDPQWYRNFNSKAEISAYLQGL